MIAMFKNEHEFADLVGDMLSNITSANGGKRSDVELVSEPHAVRYATTGEVRHYLATFKVENTQQERLWTTFWSDGTAVSTGGATVDNVAGVITHLEAFAAVMAHAIGENP